MSGIYIPNMVNPVRCSECDFCTYGYCGLLDRYVTDSAYKDADCPLVPVPPHGDLIDRDKLRKTMFIGEQCLYSWDEIEDAIAYAPTIIPADGKDGVSC